MKALGKHRHGCSDRQPMCKDDTSFQMIQMKCNTGYSSEVLVYRNSLLNVTNNFF
jgi:hypothetical protein